MPYFQNRCGALRLTTLLLMLALLLTTAACQAKGSDDSIMVNNTLKAYMTSLCECNISAINQYSLNKLEGYNDSQSIKEGCKILTEKITWNIENVTINGNSAIAQIKVTQVDNYESICRSALDETMLRLEQGIDSPPTQILQAQLEHFADTATKKEYVAEVTLTKIGSTWVIVKSEHIVNILSEVRTPVAAVYSVIES